MPSSLPSVTVPSSCQRLSPQARPTIARFRRILQTTLSLSLLPASLQAIDTLETSLEVLDSDLFSVSLLTLRASETLGKWEVQSSVSRADYDLDYQIVSFDFLGEDAKIKEETYSLTIAAARELNESLSLEIGAGLRDGFANYRSVWFDTYFAQQFEPLEGVPGRELYQDFSPSAASISGGLRWEYIPANATATVSISQIQDNVSPGYEIDFDGIRRSETVLASTSLSLVTENVISQRIRSRFAVTASETSGRETRYSAELAVNTALGEKLVWRNKFGASTENPQFEAAFVDTSIEYQASERIALYAGARRYHDTGEVENALLFSTAAPELDNDSLSAGLRYTGETWNARLTLAHSESDFAETGATTIFFQNLYQDADWLTAQLAFGKTF